MTKHATVAAAVLWCGTAAGCMQPVEPEDSPVSDGTSVQSIEVDGRDRSYRVFRPEKLPTSTPLVVVLHGWGFTAEQIEGDYGWNELAEKDRFVVAYPQGLGLSWNAAGDCCGPAADADVDDVAFITAMVERLAQALPIDDRRIYVAGMSNGGVLAYELACRTSLFAAVGVVAGTQVGGCAEPRPTSVIHVHGLADSIVRFDGGLAVVPDAQPVLRVVANWLRIGQCLEPEQSRHGPDVVTSTSRCADGRRVALVQIDGEGHTWPGHAGSSAPWDATAELWRFFQSVS